MHDHLIYWDDDNYPPIDIFEYGKTRDEEIEEMIWDSPDWLEFLFQLSVSRDEYEMALDMHLDE